ncbi:hypothetical protein OG326_42720 (plasmid) [Nocardia sp. NBC_01327]|nr:hypothetical protein OG326_42720 [Nocardia sp. NBC_01327]
MIGIHPQIGHENRRATPDCSRDNGFRNSADGRPLRDRGCGVLGDRGGRRVGGRSDLRLCGQPFHRCVGGTPGEEGQGVPDELGGEDNQGDDDHLLGVFDRVRGIVALFREARALVGQAVQIRCVGLAQFRQRCGGVACRHVGEFRDRHDMLISQLRAHLRNFAQRRRAPPQRIFVADRERPRHQADQ